jgi:hypothetical protein
LVGFEGWPERFCGFAGDHSFGQKWDLDELLLLASVKSDGEGISEGDLLDRLDDVLGSQNHFAVDLRDAVAWFQASQFGGGTGSDV